MAGIEFNNPLNVEETPIKEENTEIVDESVVEVEPIIEQEQVLEIPETVSLDYPDVANELQEAGFIKHVPEDIKLDEFGKEDFTKLVQANFDKVSEEKFNEGFKFANDQLVNKIHPTINKLLSYNLSNPNADEEQINSLIGALITNNSISNLTVENDAEKIVREFYKSLDLDGKHIDEKIVRLTETEGLQKEAEMLKPKLDAKAASIAQVKLEESKKIEEYETSLQNDLEKRTLTQLELGKLNDIPLSEQQRQFLYAAIMNNETPVMLGGKKVHMGFAEALVRDAKYNPNKNIENLMLGLLVIQDGVKAIETFYKKKATTEAVEQFTKEHKFSNSRKKGSTGVQNHDELSTGISFNL